MNATKKYQIWVKVRNSFEYWTLYTEKDTLKEVIEKEKDVKSIYVVKGIKGFKK